MTLVAGGLLYDRERSRARAIVMVSDRLLSGPGASLNSPWSKIAPMGSNWLLGYAGIPGHYDSVAGAVKAQIKPDMDSDEVVSVLVNAYQSYRVRQIEQHVLGPIGFTFEEFYENGRASLGDDVFAGLVNEVKHYNLEIDFLLAGWSPKTPSKVKLVTLSHPGIAYDNLLANVAAIGAGAAIALGSLYSFFNPLGDILHGQYRMLESKFIAEAERSVGAETLMATLTHTGSEWLGATDCERIRKVWKSHQHAIPAAALTQLAERSGFKLLGDGSPAHNAT